MPVGLSIRLFPFSKARAIILSFRHFGQQVLLGNTSDDKRVTIRPKEIPSKDRLRRSSDLIGEGVVQPLDSRKFACLAGPALVWSCGTSGRTPPRNSGDVGEVG